MLLFRDLWSFPAAAHIHTGCTIALGNILVAPVAWALAAHIDAAWRASVRWRVWQLRSTRIADPQNIARLHFLVFASHGSAPLRFSDPDTD
jgi:hypothetical protein